MGLLLTSCPCVIEGWVKCKLQCPIQEQVDPFKILLYFANMLCPRLCLPRLNHCNGLSQGFLLNTFKIALLEYEKVCKYKHIPSILYSLNWLPVSSRIQYKVLLLTHKCISGHGPSFLQELIYCTSKLHAQPRLFPSSFP